MADDADTVTPFADVTNGIVVWYKFEDTVTTDSSGNNYTGTLNGATLPTLGAGKIGQGMVFPGGSGGTTLSRVTVPGAAVSVPTATSSFSVMAWVKTSFNGDGQPIFGGRSSATASPIINLVLSYNLYDNSYTNAASILIRDDFAGGSTHIDDSTALNDGVFHHVAAVFDGSPGAGNQTLKLYVDGVQKGATATAPITTSITLDNTGANVGCEYDSAWCFTGTIDDFRFYNRALSATEISNVYNAPSAPPTGTLAITQAAQTLSAAGGPRVGGTLALTQANQTLSAAGNVPVSVVVLSNRRHPVMFQRR